MPELIEVEAYRRLAEEALERKISEVIAPDAWWLKGGLSAGVLSDALVGRHFLAARRTGKRIMLDTSDHGPVLGLRFGMTGRLLVDGAAGVDHLEYSSNREVEAWDRLVVRFADGGDLRLRDPRRLGGAELDPETHKLGPDAVGLTPAGLRKVLGQSRVALKARLMDQSKIAGLGNLIVDESLFQAGLDPARPAGGLDDSTSPLLSVAKHADVLGQEMLVMTALPGRGCTGIGALHPCVWTGWAGVTDAAGEVPAVEVPGLLVRPGPVFAAWAAGPSGAVRWAA